MRVNGKGKCGICLSGRLLTQANNALLPKFLLATFGKSQTRASDPSVALAESFVCLILEYFWKRTYRPRSPTFLKKTGILLGQRVDFFGEIS